MIIIIKVIIIIMIMIMIIMIIIIIIMIIIIIVMLLVVIIIIIIIIIVIIIIIIIWSTAYHTVQPPVDNLATKKRSWDQTTVEKTQSSLLTSQTNTISQSLPPCSFSTS